MPQHLLVERALALVPQTDEYLPLLNAIIGASTADQDKAWARSGEYATVSKRLVDPAFLREQVPEIVDRARNHLQELYSRVIHAIEQQQAGSPAAAAESLVRAGELEESARRLDKAGQLYSLALQIAENLRDRAPQVLVLRRLGRVARAAGRLADAWEAYQESHRLSVDSMNLEGQIIACQGLGNLCDDRGQRSEARAWYQQGLDLALGLRRADLAWPFFTNLAALAIQDHDLEEADTQLRLARSVIEAAQDEGAMLFWYNNEGLLQQARSDASAAERVYREALERATEPFWEMRLRINLGQSLVSQGRLFEAADEARRAEEIVILNRLIPYLAEVYLLLGAIAREQGDENGFVFYEQALKVCKDQELPSVRLAAVYHQYGLLLKSCGRLTEAAAHLEHSRSIYRELDLQVEERSVSDDLAALAPSTLPTEPAA